MLVQAAWIGLLALGASVPGTGLAAPLAPDAFSFVFVPDTQHRCPAVAVRDPVACDMLQRDFDWIAEQARGELDPRLPQLPLAFVISGGDLVHQGNEVSALPDTVCRRFEGGCEEALDYSWQQVMGGWTRVAEETCVLLVPGDHDTELGTSTQRKDSDRDGNVVLTDEAGFLRFAQEAGPSWATQHTSRCALYLDDAGQPRFNDSAAGPGTGVYGSGLGLNRVAYVRTGEAGNVVRVAAVNLDASPVEMAWHAEQLAAVPGVPTIIASHAIVAPNGFRGAPQGGMKTLPHAQGARDWLATFDPHPEVFLALGGHYQPGGPTQTRCTAQECNSPRPGGTTWDQWTHNFQSMAYGGRYIVYFGVFPEDGFYCWWTIAPSHDTSGHEIDFTRSVGVDPNASGCRELVLGVAQSPSDIPGPGLLLVLPLAAAGVAVLRSRTRSSRRA